MMAMKKLSPTQESWRSPAIAFSTSAGPWGKRSSPLPYSKYRLVEQQTVAFVAAHA
jgi:hypothetical protein